MQARPCLRCVRPTFSTAIAHSQVSSWESALALIPTLRLPLDVARAAERAQRAKTDL